LLSGVKEEGDGMQWEERCSVTRMQPTLYAILPDHFTKTKSLAIKTKKKQIVQNKLTVLLENT